MPSRLADTLRTSVFRSRAYDLILGRRAPETVLAPSIDGGTEAIASAYADSKHPRDKPPGRETRGDFRWLATTAGQNARPVIADWLGRHVRWSADAWRTDILAERQFRWLCAFDDVAQGDDASAWAAQIMREAKHLSHASIGRMPPWRRFLVHQGRIAACLAFPKLEGQLQRRLDELGADTDRQVLGDGGHIERSPAKSLAVLAILVNVRDLLAARHIEPPVGLMTAIDRAAPFVKAMRLGDGGFTLVNGTTGNTAAVIDAVLARAGNGGRAMTEAPHSGFQRLRAGQTTLVVDCGKGPPLTSAHRAPAAFELSVGKQRLIGNCGARLGEAGANRAWAGALATTAAHAALVVNDKDAGPVASATVFRKSHEGARLVEIEHDAYRQAFGIGHRRTLYVDDSGADIRGEDTLFEGRSQPFSIRFHLHPDVRGSMVAGGGAVILKPPRGRGWRFQSHFPVMLEESISFHDGRQHRSQQIVILGNHEPASTTVKWRLAVDD